ncbi:MAG: diaminopimelate epimerase [Micromonosporaceae bacterium]
MRFSKGHGTGNDFVLLPDPDGALALTAGLVRALCDRRTGIGGDGVLRVVRAAKHPEGAAMAGEAEWFMDYWNADGSLAEMCGNGSRVFARYLVSHGLAAPGAWSLATRAGVKALRVAEAGDVTVDMGPPRFLRDSFAVVAGQRFAGVGVSMGNPHLVCGIGAAELDAADLGTPPEFDPGVFPDGVNVELVTPVGRGHVRMRVHERGSGETASCGTGACAVAAVELRDAGVDAGTVVVDVPGGRLTVTLDGRTSWLAGPAVIAAEGNLTA